MFEKERAEIRILSNIADAQRLDRARDLLRQAESEFARRDKELIAPATTGLPIRFEPAGEKPADVPGHVWIDERNPYAGTCESQWQWALYKLAEEPK